MRNPNSEKELAKIPGVTLMALDTTDLQQIQSVAEQVVASGGVDVVFNNAGYGLAGPLEGLSDEQVLRMVNTNMAIRTTKAFIQHFREKRAGLFINTTSIGGLMTVPFIEPGGMKTDFFSRSLDTGRHPAYDALVDKVMSAITDPKQMATYSTPEQIAEVVYEAATDGKDQLRYVAGADAKEMYAMRLQMGDRAFRKVINQQFFGQQQVASA